MTGTFNSGQGGQILRSSSPSINDVILHLTRALSISMCVEHRRGSAHM